MPPVGGRHSVGSDGSRVLPQDTSVTLQIHAQEDRPLLLAAVDKQTLPAVAELSVRAVTPRHDRTYFNSLATYKSERIL